METGKFKRITYNANEVKPAHNAPVLIKIHFEEVFGCEGYFKGKSSFVWMGGYYAPLGFFVVDTGGFTTVVKPIEWAYINEQGAFD